MSEDFYSVLDVSQDADEEEIKRAYREKAAQLHPDVSDDPNAVDDFKQISLAKEMLTDQKKRAEYDQTTHKDTEQLIHTVDGMFKRVELYDTKIVLVDTGYPFKILNSVFGNGKNLTRTEIPITDITGVRVIETTQNGGGGIQFGYADHPITDGSRGKVAGTENAVVFEKSETDDFVHFVDYFNELRGIDDYNRSTYHQTDQKTTENSIHTANGIYKQVELHDAKVIISRDRILPKFAFWRESRQEIPLSSLDSVYLKDPTRWLNGYIQFGYDNQSITGGSVVAAQKKDNTVMYHSNDHEDFQLLKNKLVGKA